VEVSSIMKPNLCKFCSWTLQYSALTACWIYLS